MGALELILLLLLSVRFLCHSRRHKTKHCLADGTNDSLTHSLLNGERRKSDSEPLKHLTFFVLFFAVSVVGVSCDPELDVIVTVYGR